MIFCQFAAARIRALGATLAAALFSASLLTSTAARADEPLRIREGWVSMTNVLSPLVFQNTAVMKHYGKSYVVEPLRFNGTSPELQAIAANEVEIITSGFSTFAAAIINANLDLRIVADGFQDGAHGYLSSPYMVRNDSEISKVEDLKGKVLANNSIGGTLDVALRVMLRKHGLEDRRDYTVVEAAFPNMNAMLLEKKVDLVADSPPFTYDPKLAADAHVLFRMDDAVGPSQMTLLAMREGFLKQHRVAVMDFFEDMLRGERWFLDPANRETALAIVANATKQPIERLQYLYTKDDYYHDPDAKPNLAALQHDMKTQIDLGFLKKEIVVKDYTDLSFIEEAARRIKQ
jgi:NitT/TauT family transport system substrate-binding protein